MSREECTGCGERLWTSYDKMYHRCQPTFLVWCPEYGQDEEDGHKTRALDHEAAAAKWADWYDSYSADYGIIGGNDVVVMVRAVDEEQPKRFLVSGETVPQYSAREEPAP